MSTSHDVVRGSGVCTKTDPKKPDEDKNGANVLGQHESNKKSEESLKQKWGNCTAQTPR